MELKKYTVCFTGHRKIPPEQMDTLARRLKKAILELIENGYLYFGAGGALGFDTLAALTILDLKAVYPNIQLILVLPCLSQTKGWCPRDVEIYEDIKNKADKVVYTSDEYTRGCLHTVTETTETETTETESEETVPDETEAEEAEPAVSEPTIPELSETMSEETEPEESANPES